LVTPDDQLRALWRAVPVLVVACVLFRGVSYALVRRGRRAGRLLEPVVLVGAGTVNVDLARSLLADRSYGLAPVGFLDDRPPDPRTLPLPVLGGPERLAEVVAGTGCGRVVVGFGLAREPDLVAVLRSGLPRRVVVYVIPRFFDLGVLPAHGPVEHVEAVPLVPLRLGDHRSLQYRCKRLVDVVVAGLALVALAPLFAVIALAVKLSSPGPVFHRQIRIGRHGRPIVVRKFRSLRVPEAVHLQVVDLDPVRTQLERDLDVRARMTRVGALLRRTALDELPQLWNVLRGDMSLVGPRPEELRYAEQFDRTVRGYGDRHRFPGGLTGWAQVHGLRGATSIETRARFDNHYIEHWSLWLDAVIVLRTAGVILRDLSGRANPARQLNWDRRKAER
jgi:exopolysaccharide biosynthesis polyprenyl glycosylphosphotransferase